MTTQPWDVGILGANGRSEGRRCGDTPWLLGGSLPEYARDLRIEKNLSDRDLPQPRLDANRANGMAVCVGRVRPCPVLHDRLVARGHNTLRGAAGAAILNAELLAARGWLAGGVSSWS